MSHNRLQTWALIALSAGLSAAIFAFDLMMPRGTGIGAYYVLVVVIGVQMPWPSAPLVLAAVVTVLSPVGHILSVPGDVPWWLGIANRSLALFATWLTAALLVRRRTAEQALRASKVRASRAEERLRDALQVMSDGFVLWDADDRLVLCNGRYRQLFRDAGCSIRSGSTFEEMARWIAESGTVTAARREDAEAWLAERLDRHRHRLGEPFEQELKNGTWLRLCEYRTAEGGIVGVLTDITDLKRRERALRESEERYRRLVEMAPDAILIQQDGRFTFANPQAVELLGAQDASQIVDRPVAAFIHPEDWPAVEARLRRLGEGATTTIEPQEERMVRLDGKVIDVEDRTATITERGRVATQGILRDVTGRKWAEEYIRRLAHHDALTGLPNRLLLQDRLQQAIAQARREGGHVAVMLLDLDHFKDVNDTLGHPAGDQLLCAVADRLRALVRETDTLARLGGDEFVIVQTGLREVDGANVLAQKVINALAEPFAIEHNEVHTSTSVGITLFPQDGAGPDLLIRNADLALYRAKAEGRGRFRLFVPAMTAEIQARKGMENDLRRALELGQLGLCYQPQLDLSDGRIVGVEALVRWRHPRHGNVPPAVFVPVAETSGLIRPLGAWVLSEACRQAKIWRNDGRALGVAVNLSPAQLLRQNMVEELNQVLGRHDLEPHVLELEITENVFADPARRAISGALQQVAELGVNLTIDDFGTGYASFSYLKNLPITKIKINGTFVRDIGCGRDGEAIVHAIVALGHNMNKRVLAEGVEREAQLAFLSEQGCDQAQGFLLGRPQTPEDLGRFLAVWPETWRTLKAAVGLIASGGSALNVAGSCRGTLH